VSEPKVSHASLAKRESVFDDSKRNTKFYRDAIFPLGLVGEASFHQMLSNMALYLRLARGTDDGKYTIRDELKYEREEEVIHQTKVYNLVNNMIAKKEETSEDAISAVGALACYAVG
jgi:hypothetical protein